jgi:streptogramin lyase
MLSMLALVAACSSAGAGEPAADGTAEAAAAPESPQSRPEPAQPEASATEAPAPAEEVLPELPIGVWEGTVVDGDFSFPIFLSFGACKPGSACAALKYETFSCGGNFTYLGQEQGQALFQENITFGKDQCLSGTIVHMQYRSPEDPLLLQWTGPDGTPGPVGELRSAQAISTYLEGFGREVTRLSGGWWINWFPMLGHGSLWVPNGRAGTVERVDLGTMEVVASVQVGDPQRALWNMDPNAIAISGNSIWVTQRAERAVGRIDPATNQLVQSIGIEVEPYDIAVDGDTLWVTAFEEDSLVRVDAAAGEVVAVIPDILKPTGVTTAEGFVWVVEHRNGNLVQVDPATNAVVTKVRLGGQVGALPENIIYAYGSLWTPNNTGKTISRIDPATLEETLIEFPKRPGRIMDTGGRIWVGLWFNLGATGEYDEIVQIDPATNQIVQSVEFPPGVSVITDLGGTLLLVDRGYDVHPQEGDQIHVIELLR